MTIHLIYITSDGLIHNEHYEDNLSPELFDIYRSGLLTKLPCILGETFNGNSKYIIQNYYTSGLDFISEIYSGNLTNIIPKSCIEEWCIQQSYRMLLKSMQ